MKILAKENIKKIAIYIIFLILIIIVIYCVIKKSKTKSVQNTSDIKQNTQIQVSNAKKVNLDEIISKNSNQQGYKEEIVVEEEELEYITKYQNNPDIYIGETKVSQEGRNGTQAITIKKIYDKNNKLIKQEQVSAVVVKSSINKIVDIGTKKKEIPKKKQEKKDIKSKSSLDFNTALNKPSGFNLEQFTKCLTDDKDKNNIFKDNAKYFYYIEDEYKINGLFVAAVGIHESSWGTSKLAINKKNLFGYGAYDSNPYNGAYSFDNYAESIDLMARVFVKYYINPSGTNIYDGGKAKGS